MSERTETETEFLRGWIMAVSTVFYRTGDDVSCYESLQEAGISYEDTQEFDLCSLDAGHMIRIFWHHGLSEALDCEGMNAGEYIAMQEK